MSPACESPVRSKVSMASGTEAAEVLPASTMSRATTVAGFSFSRLVIASVIRRFAWCGMKASTSSIATPARSRQIG